MEDQSYRSALSVFIQSIKSGAKYHEYSLDVGMTPSVLLGVGVPELPVTISVKVIDKCYFEHGVTEATLGRLYELIANPTAVYKSDSPHLDHVKVEAVVLVTIECKEGNPLLIVIHANKAIGRRQVNQIKSVYDKKDAVVQKWRDNGLLLWNKPAARLVQVTATSIKPVDATPVVTIKKARQFSKN